MTSVVSAGGAIVALVAIVVVALTGAVRDHQRAERSTARSAVVLNTAQLAERHVVDLETGVRGYSATGRRLFLAPWSASRVALPGELAKLRRLVADNPGQRRRARALQAAVDSYITAYTVPFVARVPPLSGEALTAFTVRGKALLDGLRRQFDRFDTTEQALQASRDRRWAAGDRTWEVVGVAATLVLVLAIASLVLLVARRFSAQEQELRESLKQLEGERLRLDEAQSVARVGSWSWDSEADRATWSTEMYRIFERDHRLGPAVTEEFLAYLPPPDRERIATGYAEAFGGGPLFDLDFQILPASGIARTLHARGRRDPGLPPRYSGTVQDVTELRQAESDLRRERDYAAAITSSMREGFLLTLDGVILEVNRALCELTGFPREELLGLRVPYPFWAPEAAEEITRQRKLIRSDVAHEFEVTYRRKDGTRFAAAITTVMAAAGDGKALGYVSTVRDVSERNRYEAELQRRATHDPLTGLANHRVFHERLVTDCARAARQGQPLSIALIDLDKFKHVNDRHGHPAGDSVLIETAARLSAVVREGDLLARVGGEEFAWLLNTDGLGAVAASERARYAMSAIPFPQVGTVTLSGGVCDLTAAGTSERLYELADQALYLAKKNGRNRTIRYTHKTARELAGADSSR
jgi:diguanylate cyclase (GGDEF)-like protein/PAS domain S-box-containing protein